ncbi:HNH endonuclease [Escherichia coli]|uniref:HNH endonuclease n=1 Tax=Escherichia coli TaxID=562 RepID=UPI001CD0A5D0|nr:HNH endonuclease [Escherichia coli]
MQLVTRRQLKYEYVIKNWELRGGIVYSKHTGKPIIFSLNKTNKRLCRSSVIPNAQRQETGIKGILIWRHEAVWMLHHNKPIPDGCFAIHHIDNNKLNDVPDNLILLSTRLHCLYHHFNKGDSEPYFLTSNPRNKCSPWVGRVTLPTGQRLAKFFKTAEAAAEWVERQRKPIIENFKRMGIWR